MTPRTLWFTALAIALSVQIGMLVTYGVVSEWCFCALTTATNPPIPPPYVMRFLELSTLPTAFFMRGLPVSVLLMLNLEAWFFMVLGLLHGMTFVARLRVRARRDEAVPRGRRIQLASRESVRLGHMLLVGSVLTGVAMAGGAAARHRWLSKAEDVLAQAMAAAGTDGPFPAGVAFSMYEERGDDWVPVTPAGRFVMEIDPAISGDRFLDAFVVPYEYGGMLRSESGTWYEFSVGIDHLDGRWNVSVHTPMRRRARW